MGRVACLSACEDDGLAQSRQGLGYWVTRSRIDICLDNFPRWGANAARAGRSGVARLTSARIMRASHDLARDMRLTAGKQVYMAELVRTADGQAIALSRSHFPMERFRGILNDVDETGSVTQALARHGVSDCQRSRTRLEARMPTAREAVLIGIPRGQPVMVSTGINTDGLGDVVEVSISAFRADSVAFDL